MKAFLKKTIFFLLPIVICFMAMEPLLRNIPNDYSYKNNYLKNNSNKISKLFLGSSHTYYGINPEFISGNSFNGSHISQSINLDYEILKKYKNNLDELEYLVIPIDYFTLFSRMRNGVEYWRAKNYNLYYDIQLSNKLSENSEVLSINVNSNIRRIGSYYILNRTPITCSNLGYGNIYVESKDLDETGKTAALRHTTKDFSKLNETIKILEEIIDWASKNNTEIIFYTTPAYKTYVSNLNADQLELTRKTITKLVEKNTNCSYFNLLEDPDFYASDFSDADHLNQEGAKKLSIKLDELIITSQKEEL